MHSFLHIYFLLSFLAITLFCFSIQKIDQAPLLAQDNELVVAGNKNDNITNDESRIDDNELRKMLKDIFLENARLRKQVNSVIRRSLKTDIMSENNHEDSS